MMLRIDNWRTQRRAQLPLNVKLGDRITILTTPHAIFVAHLIYRELARAGYQPEITTGAAPRRFGPHLHFVLCPQMFRKLPRLYFAVQMEQSVSSRWFDESYIGKMSRAVAVLDYSKRNVAYLQTRGLPTSRIYYCPIGHFDDYASHVGLDATDAPATNAKYDVVFYGDTKNPRRAKILEEIAKHFSLLVINHAFSLDLYKQLRNARTVINLHYYENALLETTRIYECLSLGLPVISEKACDQDEHQALDQRVRFVEVDDLPGMLDAIRQTLHSAHDASTSPVKDANGDDAFSFYFNRVLLAHDLLDFERFDERFGTPFEAGDTRPKCLTLTETVERHSHFASTYGDSFELVEGLRHRVGWIGCALSYKFYARRALRSPGGLLVMCEDDVVLPENHQAGLHRILSYLAQRPKQWDLFSGFIAHLKDDATILDVDSSDGGEFITLDRMTSMVLNVYASRSLELISTWDETVRDAEVNTIDRYLELSDLHVVTTFPFFAGHEQALTSTLWGFSNCQYAPLITDSERQLQLKLNEYKLRHAEGIRQ